MNNIILSIKSTLDGLNNEPCMIYVGVGTYAGLMTEKNGIRFLEDKNYHQFPPTIQQIFMENRDMHLFIILIDPAQENPIYMATDKELKNKLFDGNEWACIEENDFEMYVNNRITVYPFRKAVYTQPNNYQYDEKYIDITQDLLYLNRLCIEHDLTFVYHDFSGIDSFKSIENYFYDFIKDDLDHIIYGFGNGFISGCYFDLTEPRSFLATITEIENRKIIKAFNIKKMMNEYNKLKSNTSITEFMTLYVDKFGIQNAEIIYGQIENMINEFKYNFKNYTIYILRILKDFNNISKKKDDIKYYIRYLSSNIINSISNMIEQNEPYIFDKTIKLISEYYDIELKLCLLNTDYKRYQPIEILHMITSNENKYKWFDEFSSIIGL